MFTLDKYQTDSVDSVARKVGEGFKKIIFQLPTGAGKTICFSYLCKRYLDRFNKEILIIVHREELLNQSKTTLYDLYNIKSEAIIPKNKNISRSDVYIGMVETCNNRLKKNENYFRNVGLVIIDECHIGSFTKIHQYFDNAIIIGVTATPISASKKLPMNKIYQTICCGVDIPFLIDFHCKNPNRGLVPCITYAANNGNIKSSLHVRGGDYDQGEMSQAFSKSKHVNNTVEKYIAHGNGKKALVFNCSIEHNCLVNQAFIDAGFNSRHLDSEHEDEYRKETLKWFKDTPGAILNNVGILTTGFDEPSIEVIIPNRATKSLPLWLQMCGRGARPYQDKQYFTIIDMGDNVKDHLEWSEARDWEWEFNNPGKPKKASGVAPIKICIECEGIIPIQAVACKWCGALQPIREPTYDDILGEFIIVTRNLDVKALIKQQHARNNQYQVLHKIKESVIKGAPKGKIGDEQAYKLLAAYNEKVQEWCKETNKRYDDFHKIVPAEWFMEEMLKVFKWKPPLLSL